MKNMIPVVLAVLVLLALTGYGQEVRAEPPAEIATAAEQPVEASGKPIEEMRAMTLTTLLLVAVSVLVVSALPSWGYRDGGTCYSLDIFEIALLGAGILILLIFMG